MVLSSTLARYLALAIVMLPHVSGATSSVRSVISTATGGAGTAASKSTRTRTGTAVIVSSTTAGVPELTISISMPSTGTPATPAPSIPNKEGGGGLSPELKIGLGIGLGIGIPLIALLGLGCFFLWRLWGRQNPHQQPVHNGDRDVADYPVKERAASRELLSTQLYEADGEGRGPQTQTSPRMQPVELNA